MRLGRNLTRKDIIVLFGCILFVLMNIGAIGSGGRRRAKEMVCLSNLRQWGDIFETYTKDNNGYFMEGFTSNNRWIRALGSYHKYDSNFSCCPEATKPWVDLYGNSTDSSGGAFMAWGYMMQAVWMKPMKGSYGTNGWITNPESGREPILKSAEHFWRTPDVQEASNVPVFFGNQRYNAYPQPTDAAPEYDGMLALNEDMTRVCINRHNGGVNMLFMDWSVRKVGLKELWTLKWHRMFDTKGPWTIAGGVWPSDWPEWMRNFKDF